MINFKGGLRGWDRCENNIDGICCKDIETARTWICVKGFPRLKGKYVKCKLPKGTMFDVCEYFKEE